MTAVHSPRWYRVANLKPRLATTVRLRRQRVRGQDWVLLADPASGRSVRLNAAAWAVAGRFDGAHTVQQVWEHRLQHDADAVTQDEVIELLAQLREASLVAFDRAADFDAMLPHLDSIERPAGRRSLLAWRLPLADPTALLDRLRPLGRLLFTPALLALWLAGVATLALLAAQHAPTLWAHATTWMPTPRYALLAALLFVPIKLVHELSHGLAVQRWGGRVSEAGVTLMMLMPVPYVDASAATIFTRRQRIVVGAAGMMAELALAAVALPLWLWLDDGIVRDAAFVTLVIAGVSTLVFNANPLQRLDGYTIASDALDLPNLGPRSRRWWSVWISRRVLRLPGAEAMPAARGETPWLVAYAPLSWLNGIGIAALAVAWLGGISLALGLVAGALLGWQMVLKPMLRLVDQQRRAALAQRASAGRWQRVAAAGAVGVVALLLLPLPQRTVVQGVVWPPDDAQLRADSDGFVDHVAGSDGNAVAVGDPVLRLANPPLLSQLERQTARVGALEAALFQAQAQAQSAAGDGARAGDAGAELAAAQAELDRLGERVAALDLRAAAAGRLALPQAADLDGRWLRRGALIGQVLTDEAPTVRVAVPESAAGDLRRDGGPVQVVLASAHGRAVDALLLRDSGGAVRRLPSAALGQRHGGRIATDPSDPDGLQALQPVVLLDVRLASSAAGGRDRIGERAWVRFDAGFSPLAWQLARGIHRRVMRQFNPNW